MTKANESESTGSGKGRVCARNKKLPCAHDGESTRYLERQVEVLLWTIRKSRVKSLGLGSKEEPAMRDFETR